MQNEPVKLHSWTIIGESVYLKECNLLYNKEIGARKSISVKETFAQKVVCLKETPLYIVTEKFRARKTYWKDEAEVDVPRRVQMWYVHLLLTMSGTFRIKCYKKHTDFRRS